MKPKITQPKRFLIKEDVSVKEAMRRLGQVGERILYLVNNKNQLLGSLTDGDIRRWVLGEGALNAHVGKIINKKPIKVREHYDLDKIKKLMVKRKIVSVPVVRKDNVVCEVLIWDKVFGKEMGKPKGKIDLPVVIMAGGKGTRLDPFTKVLPKPLIPIGEKSIIEIIMEKFHQYHIEEFYLSINHKSRMIKAYFEEINPSYTIHYIEEEKPLGTIGSLNFMHNKIKDSLFVSNCDIIIEADYQEIVDFHNLKGNDITIIGSFRHFTIPYGICHIQNGGSLVNIQEKPEQDFLVNTGMYLIRGDALRFIPRNKFYNVTDLIQRVKAAGGKVGVFPIDENSWIDVGQWKEFHRATKLLELES